MNTRQRAYVDDAASRTSEALDELRRVEERQAVENRPRLVSRSGVSIDYERDHWRQCIIWQGIALLSEEPALLVPVVRRVMDLKPQQSRWRLQRLMELWAQVGGPDNPVLRPPRGSGTRANISRPAA